MFNNKNIFIALTYKCNAFCKKCMTRYHVNKATEMDVIVLNRILSLLQTKKYSGYVSVGTGEVLLYDKLDYFVKGVLSVNDKIRLRMLTNGMLLSGNNNPLIFSDRCKWGVTMDAFNKDTLFAIQKGVDIEQVKRNVSNVAQKFGPNKLYLNFTVYQNNIDQILPFCKFAVENGITEIYLTELKIFAGYEKDLRAYKVVHDKRFEEAICEANEYLAKHSIDIRGISFGPKQYRERCYTKCTASPIIDVDGSVSFCSGREDMHVGNILDDNIEDKWHDLAEGLKKCNSTWCNFCYDRMLADGTYRLPRTIRKDY